jgi:hypothetical protein
MTAAACLAALLAVLAFLQPAACAAAASGMQLSANAAVVQTAADWAAEPLAVVALPARQLLAGESAQRSLKSKPTKKKPTKKKPTKRRPTKRRPTKRRPTKAAAVLRTEQKNGGALPVTARPTAVPTATPTFSPMQLPTDQPEGRPMVGATQTGTGTAAQAAPRLRPGGVGCDVPNDPNSCVTAADWVPSPPYEPVEFIPMGRRLLQARLRGQQFGAN